MSICSEFLAKSYFVQNTVSFSFKLFSMTGFDDFPAHVKFKKDFQSVDFLILVFVPVQNN